MENQDKHVPPHLDPTPPQYTNSEMDDRTPPRVIQAMTFFHSYCVVRIVCSERLWQGTWGGKEGAVFDMAMVLVLVAVCVVSFYLQIRLQSQCIVQLAAVLALPPFYDSGNKLLARRIGKLTPPTHRDVADDVAALAAIGADMSREHARAVGLMDRPWRCEFCEDHFETMEACQEHEKGMHRGAASSPGVVQGDRYRREAPMAGEREGQDGVDIEMDAFSEMKARNEGIRGSLERKGARSPKSTQGGEGDKVIKFNLNPTRDRAVSHLPWKCEFCTSAFETFEACSAHEKEKHSNESGAGVF
jgi:hypothetical protein